MSNPMEHYEILYSLQNMEKRALKMQTLPLWFHLIYTIPVGLGLFCLCYSLHNIMLLAVGFVLINVLPGCCEYLYDKRNGIVTFSRFSNTPWSAPVILGYTLMVVCIVIAPFLPKIHHSLLLPLINSLVYFLICLWFSIWCDHYVKQR